jgi:hypothetical protein
LGATKSYDNGKKYCLDGGFNEYPKESDNSNQNPSSGIQVDAAPCYDFEIIGHTAQSNQRWIAKPTMESQSVNVYIYTYILYISIYDV